MALAIYKPGQGYWTRVLSVAGAAVLVLAVVAWLWNEMEAIGSGPTTVQRSTLAASQMVADWGVETGNPVSAIAEVRRIEVTPPAEPGGAARFTLIDARGSRYDLDAAQLQAALNRSLPNRAISKSELLTRSPVLAHVDQSALIVEMGPTFAFENRMYIQAGVAVSILLISGGLIFLVLNRPRIVDFMIATEAEMRKVNWPTRREIVGSTWIVICGTFMMALMLLVVDVLFAELFITTRVLEGQSLFVSLYSQFFGG